MKKHTTILLTSQARQEMLDQMNQSIQTVVDIEGADFDDNTKNNIMAEVMETINNFRIIEERIFSLLGISYTRKIYNPGVSGYMMKVPVPQFTTVSAYQMYYTEKLAALTAEIEAEQIETKFVSEDAATLNQQITKDSGGVHTYSQAETDILASIVVMQASLIGDNPDSAVS